MMLQLGLFAVLFAVVFSAPQSNYVQWFEMEPAKKVQRHNLAKTIFEDLYTEWEKFKNNHGKTYENLKEEEHRFGVFTRNLEYIKKHNTEYNAGLHSYYLGVNHLADLEVEEFRKLNGYRKSKNASLTTGGCSTYLSASNVKVPDEVDWRKEGYVTPVKNQGQCGSCWSFSTTGSLEGQTFKKTQILISLSEQQLVDCSGKFGNEGCNGGLMDNAFAYIKSVGGIESEEEYPYKHKQSKCKAVKSEFVAEDTGCVDVESGSEDKLKEALATVGPISVAIDASHQSFQLYESGVYDEPDCSSEQLDHGVLTVGYGTSDDGQDYWIVKNSWGTTWGKEGYIMMSRNKKNQCGIATQASYPLV